MSRPSDWIEWLETLAHRVLLGYVLVTHTSKDGRDTRIHFEVK